MTGGTVDVHIRVRVATDGDADAAVRVIRDALQSALPGFVPVLWRDPYVVPHPPELEVQP